MSNTRGIGLIHGDGFLILDACRYRVAIGERGIVRHKQEGDRSTPAGLLPLRRVLYRADRTTPPPCLVPIEPIARTDAWCDDRHHPDYNRPITLPHAARHETLWRPDALYDVIGVLGWNDNPITPGNGSAIFLHVAHTDYRPTAGCLALTLPDLRTILAAGLIGVEVVGG